MDDAVREFATTEPSLNTVQAGLLLAKQAVAALASGERVRIDLTKAERMTPSFANALVMTMLGAIGESAFEARVAMLTHSPVVQEAWTKAVERYKRGVRLSTQQTGAA